MRLGVSTYAFGWAVGVTGYPVARPFGEFDLLGFARGHNLQVVQIGDHLPLHTWGEERLVALRTEAAKQPAFELEIGARGLTDAHLARYIDLAAVLGAPLLRFVVDAKDWKPTPEQVIAIVRGAVPSLERAEVTLGIENHDRFSVHTLRRIIETIDSDRVGICLDTANSLGAGEGITEVVEQLAHCTVNLHVKDFTIMRVPYAMGFTVQGRPAGSGMLNLPKLRDAIAVGGRCRSVILETWVPPELELAATIAKERQWAEESITYLKNVFPT